MKKPLGGRAFSLHQLENRYTPGNPIVSHAAPQDSGEEQGVFLHGNEGILLGQASLI
ncbi:MAG: hypothetical protein ABSD72_12275 [Terracidiphilus sp.]|jgi:hypothetical protein